MADKGWFDDYMDYKMSSGSDEAPSDNGGCLPGLLVVLAVMGFLFKLLS